MDLNILPEACLAYDTSADSENVPQDPAITKPDTMCRVWQKASQALGQKQDPVQKCWGH